MEEQLLKLINNRQNDIKNIYSLIKIKRAKDELNEKASMIKETIMDIVKERGIAEIIFNYTQDVNENDINDLRTSLNESSAFYEIDTTKVCSGVPTENNLDKYYQQIRYEMDILSEN